MFSRLICTVCLLAASAPVFAQAGWSLSKQGSGIRIYTRSTEGLKYKSIKVEAVLQGTVQRLVAILLDADHHKEWVYNTKVSYVLSRPAPNEVLYYAETALPWPMSNRDGAIRTRAEVAADGQRATITSLGQPDAMPPKSGKVRVPYLKGVWEVTRVDDRQIRIVYYLDVNPGGDTSPWLVNLFVTKGPYETFLSLTKQLQR